MAGRTISGANETKLRAAMEAIGAVLASLGGTDAMPMEAAEPVQLGLDGDAVEEAAVVGDFVPLVEAAVVDLMEFVPLTNQA